MGIDTDYATVRGVALTMPIDVPWEEADAEFERQIEARLAATAH